MPVLEDGDVPKLAEISRTLSDFRHEFREVVSKMVRTDVYLADIRTMDVRMTALQQDNQRLADIIREERSDRRSLRNICLTALGGMVISVLGTIGTIVATLVK